MCGKEEGTRGLSCCPSFFFFFSIPPPLASHGAMCGSGKRMGLGVQCTLNTIREGEPDGSLFTCNPLRRRQRAA